MSFLETFFRASELLLSIIGLLTALGQTEVVINWITKRIRSATSGLDGGASFLSLIGDTLIGIIRSGFTRWVLRILAFVSVLSLALRIDTFFLYILLFVTFLLVIRGTLSSFSNKISNKPKARSEEDIKIPPHLRDSIGKSSSQRPASNAFTTQISFIIFAALVCAFAIRPVIQAFYGDQLITIVVSEFAVASQEKQGEAETLQNSIYHNVNLMLNQQAGFLDATVVKADTVIQDNNEAHAIGKNLSKNGQAIVLWGFISEDNKYTPLYTFISPPDGLQAAGDNESQFIHMQDIGGTARDLATNVLAIAEFSMGLVEYWKEDYERALELFERALENDPNNYAIDFYIGNSYYYLDNYQLAEASYRKVLDSQSGLIAPMNNLAIILTHQDKLPEALELLEAAIKIDPSSSALWTNTGVVHDKLGNGDQAKACFEEAVKLNPDSPIALTNAAALLMDEGRFDEAIELLEKAAKSPEAPAGTFTNLGIAYLNVNDFSKAMNAFEASYEKNSDDTTAALGLAQIYMTQGNVDKATEWLAVSIANSSSLGYQYEKFAEIACQKGEYEPGLTLFDELIREEGGSPHILLRAAECSYQGKDTNLALSYINKFQNSRDKKKEDDEARANYLGCIITFNMGNTGQAVEYCRKTYELDTANPEYASVYAKSLFNHSIQQSDTTYIKELLELEGTMSESDSTYGNYLTGIAQLYTERGDYIQSLKYYNQALSLDLAPKDKAFALYNSCVLNINIGASERAVETCRNTYEYDSDNSDFVSVYGKSLFNYSMQQADTRYVQELLSLADAMKNDDSTYGGYLTGIAQLYTQIGDYEQSLTFYNQAIELDIDPRDKAFALYNRAFIYQQLNRHEESQQHLTQFIDYVNASDLRNKEARLDSVIAEVERVIG